MTEVHETTPVEVIFPDQASSDLTVHEEPVFKYPPLTLEEDTFALAMVECAGNVAAAYKMAFGLDAVMPLARGKELLTKPAIALKIRDLTDKIEDASLISVGAHLNQLANIRDIAIATGQIKVAYSAERSRGEAVGIYQKHDAKNQNKGTGAVNIQINMASKHDASI
jgi:hypothetical protein